ncbi:uncharacterized protein LOC133141551 [Conger conger]|uniref:uncharacterized protein LOC133141551 n=1 Tax=Conger conger TaxID=82655 RepID=UPI002A59F7FC|nr:uncharacterized protein LOC133141551 [Conger conger]
MRLRYLLHMLIVASISSWLLFSLFWSHLLPEAIGWPGNIKPALEKKGLLCQGPPDGETVVPACGGLVLLVSAFRDERFSRRTVRVIGVARRTGLPPLFCHICTGPSVFSVPAAVLIHSDHFGFAYGTTDFLCQWKSDTGLALRVSVSDRELPDLSTSFLWIHETARNSTAPFPRQFSVCISTLFGNYSNVLQFVQSLEMYRLLGAGKVFVYKSSCPPLLQKVLDHYSSTGLLEVVPWDVGRHLKVSNSWKPSLGPGDLHYHGQIAALNDCIYRNMVDSAYVVLVDIDELIIPRLHQTWGKLMDFLSFTHPGVVTFLFEDTLFRNTVFGDDGRLDIWPHVPGVNILRHVHREPFQPLSHNARKLLVNPRLVVWTSVHDTLWLKGTSLNVPPSVAYLHHCRKPRDMSAKDSQLLQDTSLWKYSAPLIRNVFRTLSQVLGT